MFRSAYDFGMRNANSVHMALPSLSSWSSSRSVLALTLLSALGGCAAEMEMPDSDPAVVEGKFDEFGGESFEAFPLMVRTRENLIDVVDLESVNLGRYDEELYGYFEIDMDEGVEGQTFDLEWDLRATEYRTITAYVVPPGYDLDEAREVRIVAGSGSEPHEEYDRRNRSGVSLVFENYRDGATKGVDYEPYPLEGVWKIYLTADLEETSEFDIREVAVEVSVFDECVRSNLTRIAWDSDEDGWEGPNVETLISDIRTPVRLNPAMIVNINIGRCDAAEIVAPIGTRYPVDPNSFVEGEGYRNMQVAPTASGGTWHLEVPYTCGSIQGWWIALK